MSVDGFGLAVLFCVYLVGGLAGRWSVRRRSTQATTARGPLPGAFDGLSPERRVEELMDAAALILAQGYEGTRTVEIESGYRLDLQMALEAICASVRHRGGEVERVELDVTVKLAPEVRSYKPGRARR